MPAAARGKVWRKNWANVKKLPLWPALIFPSASPSCFQPLLSVTQPAARLWLAELHSAQLSLAARQVITALPLYGYCTASNKGWLKKVIEKVDCCWEGSPPILPARHWDRSIIWSKQTIWLVSRTREFSLLIPKVYHLNSPLSLGCTRADYVWGHQLFPRLAFLPQKLICGCFKNAPLFAEGNNDSSLFCENS